MIIQLEMIPVLLNRLYIPIIRNGKPSIIKSKDAKEFVKYVQMECLRQKIKLLNGPVSVKIDILRQRGKNDIDCDSVLKLLLDSLENICYTNDSQICEIIIRKHLFQESDGINILCERIEDKVLKEYYDKKIRPRAG